MLRSPVATKTHTAEIEFFIHKKLFTNNTSDGVHSIVLKVLYTTSTKRRRTYLHHVVGIEPYKGWFEFNIPKMHQAATKTKLKELISKEITASLDCREDQVYDLPRQLSAFIRSYFK